MYGNVGQLHCLCPPIDIKRSPEILRPLDHMFKSSGLFWRWSVDVRGKSKTRRQAVRRRGVFGSRYRSSGVKLVTERAEPVGARVTVTILFTGRTEASLQRGYRPCQCPLCKTNHFIDDKELKSLHHRNDWWCVNCKSSGFWRALTFLSVYLTFFTRSLSFPLSFPLSSLSQASTFHTK